MVGRLRPKATAAPRPCRPRGTSLPTLLIADPSAGARHALAAQFQRKGYDVWAAEGLASALPIVTAERPELVISELRFSDGTWHELLVLVKARAPDARLIVVTSQASVATVVRAIRDGVSGYVTKPATADQVLAAMFEDGMTEEGDGAGTPEREEAAAPRWLTLDEAIWEYINQTMELAGSMSAAARRLGLDRRSLRRMLAKHSQLR